MWKPIRRRENIPRIDDSETLYLDFKAKPTDSPFEIGKDVAAFANASGGTLLVGAVASGKKLLKFQPLDDASSTVVTYENAINARCRPRPAVTWELVSFDNAGSQVLAVNIEPFLGQLVGVHIPKNEQKGMKPIEGLYHYPLRVNDHTQAILPENLAMHIDARNRRIAIILEPLVGTRAVLQSVYKNKSINNGPLFNLATIKKVSISDNTVELATKKSNAYHLPIDLIHSIGRNGQTVVMFVYGYFQGIDWNETVEDEYKTNPEIFRPILSSED